MQMRSIFLPVFLIALAGVPAGAMGSPAGLESAAPSQQQGQASGQQSQATASPAPAGASASGSMTGTIGITEDVVANGTTAFARSLSHLLGVEVALPARQSLRLALPAGDYSVDKLLDNISRQFAAAGLTQGMWRQVFIVRPAAEGADPSAIAAAPRFTASRVSLEKKDAPFAEIARAVADAAGCTVELPSEEVPGRYSLRCEDIPAEEALARLAAQAKQQVHSKLIFSADTGRRDSRAQRAEERQLQQGLAQQVEESRYVQDDLALLSAVGASTGLDPLDPRANWAGVDPAVWERLGFRDEDVNRFVAWAAERAENLRLTEDRSWDISAQNMSKTKADDGTPADPSIADPGTVSR